MKELTLHVILIINFVRRKILVNRELDPREKAFFIAVYYCGLEGTGEAPSWVYFNLAFSLFVYQTMDAIDGKQARRTGTGIIVSILLHNFYLTKDRLSGNYSIMDLTALQMLFSCLV